MKASEIRSKYLKFYEARGHAIIPAAPIVPLEDPTTLFTSSGMQPLVPYLKGEPHSMGTRLVDSQPSFRAEDIEEIGDNRHITMFEMLGNWSLGDYFKKEQLPWFYEFVTSEVGLDPKRLHVTLFEGDEFATRDTESYEIWRKVGVAENHIHYYPAKKNWWSRAGVPANMPPGEIGGPDSEMFYDFGEELKIHEQSEWKNEECHVNCDCGRYLEIGNSVFMQFEKQADGSFKPLPKQNVDFGGGLERLVAASIGNRDIFTIDMFAPIIKAIEVSSGKSYEGNESPMRVIADHLRAATFMMAEGLEPSNKMQGYVLRRLLRRAAVKARELGGDAKTIFAGSIPTVIKEYSEAGFVNEGKVDHVLSVMDAEMTKFGKALDRGLKEIGRAKAEDLTAHFVFDLFQSYGFPYEVSEELAIKKGVILDKSEFDKVFDEHKQGSRTASAGMFKGGLADHSEITTKLHTATHLLHKALRTVLGTEVHQAGSNITPERLRFDYTYAGKPTPEQLKEIESMINDKIKEDLPVTKRIEDKKEAIESGAMAFFAEKYPDKVSVYIIGTNPDKDWYSKELCGGPHVEHTGTIGGVTIFKDESLGSGTRRIYARLK
ncbi:alanine--tRNA ligase [Candidatus Woesebacteria bacterium]|nr:alanine--tRNA ligase [Candidatus Woesebacteria bacterium]